MGHIFISYSHKDSKYVEKLEKKLISEGFDVWIDHRINYGSRWTKEIEKAIDTCDAYIVVMSKDAKESQWVQREVIHAEKRRKPFFPLLLKGERWFSLGNIQFVDVEGGKIPPKDFYEDLAMVVSRKQVGQGQSRQKPPSFGKKFKQHREKIMIGLVVLALLTWGAIRIFSSPEPAQPIDQDPVDVTLVPATLPAEPTESALAPPDTPQSGEAWTRPTDGMVMSYIPVGEFEMGSEAGEDNEKPAHTVYLDAFWMDQTEVTNALYAECVYNGRCDEPSDTIYLYDPSYAEHPVVYVNWQAAQNYCERVGGRLPTEAEWEKAARGGLEGEKYPWGGERPVCNLGAVNGENFDDNKKCNDSGTKPVASFSVNGYGLYDMVGNVWEWVLDWYSEDFYSTPSLQNPLGPESGELRVTRGGSWLNIEIELSSALRHMNSPYKSYSTLGFRCARSASE